MKVFKVHFFQEGTTLMHTGIVLEHNGVYTRYDFGYETITGALLNFWNGSSDGGFKYFHLRFKEIQKSDLPPITHTLEYNVQDDKVVEFGNCFLDSSFYALPVNNCRHYILRTIERLSKGRELCTAEKNVYDAFNKILYSVDHVRCPNCGDPAVCHIKQ